MFNKNERKKEREKIIIYSNLLFLPETFNRTGTNTTTTTVRHERNTSVNSRGPLRGSHRATEE